MRHFPRQRVRAHPRVANVCRRGEPHGDDAALAVPIDHRADQGVFARVVGAFWMAEGPPRARREIRRGSITLATMELDASCCASSDGGGTHVLVPGEAGTKKRAEEE